MRECMNNNRTCLNIQNSCFVYLSKQVHILAVSQFSLSEDNLLFWYFVDPPSWPKS